MRKLLRRLRLRCRLIGKRSNLDIEGHDVRVRVVYVVAALVVDRGDISGQALGDRFTECPDQRLALLGRGDISDMTLWRWIKERNFPKPAYIGRRRYWKESEVIGWLDKQASDLGSSA